MQNPFSNFWGISRYNRLLCFSVGRRTKFHENPSTTFWDSSPAHYQTHSHPGLFKYYTIQYNRNFYSTGPKVACESEALKSTGIMRILYAFAHTLENFCPGCSKSPRRLQRCQTCGRPLSELCSAVIGYSTDAILFLKFSSNGTIVNVNLQQCIFFGRPFVKRFALYHRTSVCLSVMSCHVCDVGVLWPNGWTDQDETWHACRPRPWPHCVRWWLRSRHPKGHNSQFSAHICCGQTAAWIKVPLGMEIGLGPSHIVLHGNPAPSPQ